MSQLKIEIAQGKGRRAHREPAMKFYYWLWNCPICKKENAIEPMDPKRIAAFGMVLQGGLLITDCAQGKGCGLRHNVRLAKVQISKPGLHLVKP